MGVFFSVFCGPTQQVVEPRKSIRLSWYYYTSNDDDILQYYKVFWKPATIKGWTDPAVKTATVQPGVSFYDLPANSFALGDVFSWRVESWVVDKDYDPNAPTVDPSTGDPVTPVSGTPFNNSSFNGILDATGYTLFSEANGTFASGNQGFAFISQKPGAWWTIIPSDPGEYEVRFRVSNGFQWSDYSTPTIMVQYDTRKWVKKANNRWWAVPVRKKKSTSGFDVVTP